MHDAFRSLPGVKVQTAGEAPKQMERRSEEVRRQPPRLGVARNPGWRNANQVRYPRLDGRHSQGVQNLLPESPLEC
jgi:hypothetical protein